MDTLLNPLIWDILRTITTTVNWNFVSLACKHFNELENEQTLSLRIGCGMKPMNEALNTLCKRFPNLMEVEIIYSRWMFKLGKQLDGQGLLALSNSCPFLANMTLSYCTFITNAGIVYLASCSKLSSLKLIFTPRNSGCELLSVVMGCKKLSVLHLIRCLNISSAEWLEHLGKLDNIVNLFNQELSSY